MPTKLERLTKVEMCDIINEVRGYSVTPDIWSKEELLNYLIDGGIYTTYQWRQTNAN